MLKNVFVDEALRSKGAEQPDGGAVYFFIFENKVDQREPETGQKHFERDAADGRKLQHTLQKYIVRNCFNAGPTE